MADDVNEPDSERFTTSRLAASAGYSVQQVRDLERLEVIPPAIRKPNGYRQFNTKHVIALRAYRNLAVAVGPVIARREIRGIRDLPHDEAVARIVALHVDIARSRADAIAALQALDSIVDESFRDADPLAGDSMRITELAAAIGVRASTLRFWEQCGLITPERIAGLNTRHYPPNAIRDARVVVALRAGGYRIQATQAVMAALQTFKGAEDARLAIRSHLQTIASRSEALLRAGSDMADLLSQSAGENVAALQTVEEH